MDTRSNEFRVAYNQLVTAFVNFMNVVNPGAGTQQATLHMIAGQLDTLLYYLGSAGEVQSVNNQSQPSPVESSPLADKLSKGTAGVPDASTRGETVDREPIASHTEQPDEALLSEDVKTYYSPFPEQVKGVWKFKSASLRLSEDGQPIRERGNAYIYKLSLDENVGKGYAEIIPIKKSIDTNTFNIIANNQSEYLPSDVCVNAEMLTIEKTELRCNTKVLLEKVTKGWSIVSNQKFDLDIV